MPEIDYVRHAPISRSAGSTRHTYRLILALTSGRITQDECEQYMAFYLGLYTLDDYTINLITRRLWANVPLPLGFIKCTDGQWRHIATIAKNGRRRP